MMNKFSEIDDAGDKLDGCSEYIGLIGDGWEWNLDFISYEERTGIIIKIEDDEMAMAFKLRWF